MEQSETTTSFRDIPDIRELVKGILETFEALGGEDGFCEKFSSSPLSAFTSAFEGRRTFTLTFFRLVDDKHLRESVLASDLGDTASKGLRVLLAHWDAWHLWDSKRARSFRLTVDSNPYDRIAEQFPLRVNDIYQCAATFNHHITLNQWIIQARVRLSYPDKNFSNDDELFISCPTSSFVDSINLMLRSLRMTDLEVSTYNQSVNAEETKDMSEAFDRLQRTLDVVRKQYEASRVSPPQDKMGDDITETTPGPS